MEWIIEAQTLEDLLDGYGTLGRRIVRCKDCRFYENDELGMVWCPNVAGSWIGEDDFCSMGERREDEDV